MENESVISRIKYLINEKGLTQNEFASRIEIDASNLSKHLNGRLPVNDALINRIVVNLGVSKTWLRDGSDLPFAKPTPADSIPLITIPENAMECSKGTPVYDIDVTAGSAPRSLMFADDSIIGAIDIPNIPENCKIVKVSGDSMQPVINNGDYIAIRYVSNQSLIFWGQIYVVLLDDYRMVKYLRRHSDDSMMILRSANPEYDDIEVPRKEVRDMMIVQSIIHIDSRI